MFVLWHTNIRQMLSINASFLDLFFTTRYLVCHTKVAFISTSRRFGHLKRFTLCVGDSSRSTACTMRPTGYKPELLNGPVHSNFPRNYLLSFAILSTKSDLICVFFFILWSYIHCTWAYFFSSSANARHDYTHCVSKHSQINNVGYPNYSSQSARCDPPHGQRIP